MTQFDNNHSQRIFLGFAQPPLVTAADWLIKQNTNQHPSGPVADLSNTVVVVPTSRAQMRMLQLLVRLADSRKLVFTPPQIATIGSLPEQLYVAEKSLATDLAQQLAWSNALESTPPDEIKKLVGRSDVEDLNDWQPLAIALSRLHQRLANDIWSFRSVAREVKNINSFLKNESDRWDVLKEIQKRYYSQLDKVDLWDKQAARNFAAAGLIKDTPEVRCYCEHKIVLVGTADLNRSVSEMLRQVAMQAENQVSILIAAPESLSDRFDAYGSLVTEKWLDADVQLDDSQIRIVDQPADQSSAAADYIMGLDEDFAVDEITIGVPDPAVVPQLERSLNSCGLKHRLLAGRVLAETGPVRLLIACREYLRSQNYETFASLVRHPDMFTWLSQEAEVESWLQLLDSFQNDFLPGAIGLSETTPFGDPTQILNRVDAHDPQSKSRAERNANNATKLNRVHSSVAQLLTPLLGPRAPIKKWASPWRDVLLCVYGERLMDKNDIEDLQVLKACDAISQALDSQDQIPEGLGTRTSALQALDWAIEAEADTRVVPPTIPDAIELAGWLDLPLDDAPVMVVTGMNDEHVPTSESGHQFLPNALCESLGILDNNRRYARDAYALTVISSVRKHLLLIVGRRDEVGEPKKPSRLLFTQTPAQSTRRAKAFFSYQGKSESRFWLFAEHKLHSKQQFYIPEPSCEKPPTSLTVTSFKEYIKCPYRFYLQKILRLQPQVDDWRELSGGTFGDLAHNVLEAFGRSEFKDEKDSRPIHEFLSRQLDIEARHALASSRLPAVRIQLEQLRSRLIELSKHQAARREEGWMIVSTEELLEHELIIDGDPFVIRGKIDRVDQHEETGQLAVWDYKTSDKGELPGAAHLNRNGWKDLQLPLYRHLVKEVAGLKGANFSNIHMGYVMLPKKLVDVGFQRVEWTDDQLADADQTAFDIIRAIRRGRFWPPNPNPPLYSEDFAAICQDGVFEKYVAEVSE